MEANASHQDEVIARPTAHYARADITPAQFEQFVVELLRSMHPAGVDLQVALHETVHGMDGDYDMDTTVRYELLGMDFLVLVEAKHHTHPIKRELVQVLHHKLTSVGAHKALMVSTAPYQKGALVFAQAHGIALMTVTEGRYTFETKSTDTAPVMTRQEARDRFGVPSFVAHLYTPGQDAGSTRVQLVTPDDPAPLHEWLQ
ncbi:restriction endonuclease [Streptomyces sp. NBC_00370]|uniref:restriction endonuclease n=1 Tax=Streptomyces sp. NBC_00370 TaxID=2975728 RepID=UPI002E268DCA